MKEIFRSILNHPIATIIIISAVSNGVANIINAAKGNEIQPVISISSTSGPKKN